MAKGSTKKTSDSGNWKITMNDGTVLLRPKSATSEDNLKALKSKGYKVEDE